MAFRAPSSGPLLALIAIAVLLTMASASAGLPFETVERGDSSGIDEALTAVYRTPGEFASFWARHRSNTIPPGDPPAVDFSSQMVAAVFRGQQTSGGFGVEIQSVDEDATDGGGNKIVVNFLTSDPPPGAMVTMALAEPYHVIKLDAVDGEVAFEGAAEPVPAPGMPRYILTLDEGGEKDAIASTIEALPGVTNVKVLRSLGMLFVDFADDGSIGKREARMMLEDVNGIKSIEEEYH